MAKIWMILHSGNLLQHLDIIILVLVLQTTKEYHLQPGHMEHLDHLITNTLKNYTEWVVSSVGKNSKTIHMAQFLALAAGLVVMQPYLRPLLLSS